MKPRCSQKLFALRKDRAGIMPLPERTMPMNTRIFISNTTLKLPMCGLLVIAALLTASEGMATQFITNGGFELPQGTYSMITSLPGWFVSDNVDVQSYSQGGWPAYEGDQSIDLSGCATNGAYIEQSFPTVPGDLYQLSFHYANNIYEGQEARGRVRVMGSAIQVDELLRHSGSTQSAMNYIAFATNFLADSTLTTLRFTHIFPPSSQCQGIVLDAVGVTNLTAGCVSPPAGLVAWWPGGGNANDIVGTNNGTLHNGVAFVTAEVGQAFLFDGTQNFVQVPDSPTLSPHVGPLGEMSLEAWVRIERLPQVDPLTGFPNRAIVVKGGNPPDWEYGLFIKTNARPSFSLFHPDGMAPYGGIEAANPISTNQWHHVVATSKKGVFVRIYVDAQLAGETTSFSGDTAHGSSLLYFGRRGDGEFFDGALDEVSLYNRALSSSEVAALYTAGSLGKCRLPSITSQPPSLVGYWGKSVTFSVRAGGEPTLYYQWLKDNVPIEGACESSLILPNLQATNAGIYSVVITNTYGSTTSSNAYLTVNPAGVSLALYSGITIDGVVGLTYGIQSNTDLSNTNGWWGMVNVTLSVPTMLWFDMQPANQPQRYYRVVPGPISLP
jgi:hypothetical protein